MSSYFSLTQLREILNTNLLNNPVLDSQISVVGITTDSRNIQPGELFVALVGENFDGHNFVDTVAEKGAIAV
ncbi:MAG: Mur ligase domain-containing protein, partial [Waterburya sp.]